MKLAHVPRCALIVAVIVFASATNKTIADDSKSKQSPAATGTVEADIAYTDGTDLQKLDLYLPEKKGFATVVFTYGGGWHAGSRKNVAVIGTTLRELGFGCALL